MKLLSLADGFFLLKFSTEEDLESVLSGGPWFLLGKPFILQRWSPKFKPKCDEDAPIPVWIKIVDFPLALWTPTGISKISSYIGIAISVDALTANRSRLTFARICILISKDSPLPDEIPIEIEGEDLTLKVLYDWKPDKCEGCGSLIHPFSLCPKNPNPKPILPPQPPKRRGRSTSRPPHNRPSSSQTTAHVPPSKSTIPLLISDPSLALLSTPIPVDQSLAEQPLQNQISASNNLQPVIDPLKTNPTTSPAKTVLLPNLNSPTEETSSSSLPSSPVLNQPHKIPLLNKFASLQTEYHINPESSEALSGKENTSTSNADDDPSLTSMNQILSESSIHNTRSSVDRGKSPIKSKPPKPPKAKSAKKAKGQKS
ncbi:rho GTPase-activating protein gacJ-like [Dendrobium catenatum]|uniref:rho GTPase-activating protein gacJ-like n=1 Tax=Dendrobium catenatum TaxID=906689 RepID=UPI0009F451C8|nr:rho GTPase-activating protein gacJ-like [Dendrobium catenatum]